MRTAAYVKRLLLNVGFDFKRAPRGEYPYGRDAFYDMRHLTGRESRPTIFDVGANIGQSIDTFRGYFKSPIIHSFEPGDSAFHELREHTRGVPDLILNKLALGSRCEQKTFFENSFSDMSSFLELGKDGYGDVRTKTETEIGTIDTYCTRSRVGGIDILKIDTQGFDVEVIKGAVGMLRNRRVHLIYTEVTFADIYKRLPRIDELFAILLDNDFHLVSFYEIHHKGGKHHGLTLSS